MKYFHIYKDGSSQWRWRFKDSENGKIIADSAEGYVNRSDCFHGINLVKASASSDVYEYDAKTEKWSVVTK